MGERGEYEGEGECGRKEARRVYDEVFSVGGERCAKFEQRNRRETE